MKPKSKTKSKKKPLLIGAAVLIVLALPLGYVGAKYVLNGRIVAWRAEGFAAARAGDHQRAADALVRYLQRRPDDTDALAAYITSREAAELPNGQHYAEAIGALKLLLGKDPSRVDDRRHLLELYFKLDRRPEALDTANAVLAKNPTDTRTLEIK